jgi:hypothetical protein
VRRWWKPGAHRRGADANLLCRPVDRAEKRAIAALLVVAAIVAIGLGVLAGYKADSAALRTERADHGAHLVTATLRSNAAESASTASWGVAWVPAQWKYPHGHVHTGQVAVDLNMQAGQRVQVWVTSEGRLRSAPLTEAGVRDQVTFVVLSVLMGVAVVTGIAAACVRLLFDRRRMASWQRAWEVIGPSWTRQA